MTLQEHIRRYLELVADAESLFGSVSNSHGDLMPCKEGCDDCCSVYFELSLIEAFVISRFFTRNLSSEHRDPVLQRAAQSEPMFNIARNRFQELADADDGEADDISDAASRLRILCPLNHDEACVLYEHRPITCRIYGAPQKIGDKVLSCPRTLFRKGEKYLTVSVDEINHKLHEYSNEFLMDLIGVPYPEFSGPLFSMPQALQTRFDKEFFLSLKQTLEEEKNPDS